MSSSVEQLLSASRLDWLNACQWLEQQGEAYCIATVVAESGSLPRSHGAKMVITATHQYDTLGGGQLEFEVIKSARAELSQRLGGESLSAVQIERLSLAADLGQCCGGAAQVMFEFFNTQLPTVVIFGAGHVAHALTTILQPLPCKVLVRDSRQEWLDSIAAQGVAAEHYTCPKQAVAELPLDAYLVIMTHDHRLDYELTLEALERGGNQFVGLIGSQAKKRRFEFRLSEQLSDSARLEQLTCPIGHPDVPGKLPMQVAVSISAQLLGLFESHRAVNQANDQASMQASNQAQWDKTNQLRKTLKTCN
ncbi:xanthine dehydrogenase accessory protein XdhC [Vibrio sp. WXL103]|uniref:xanthine dehydrogenase accessory protein XdhC n=1 Tax=Vibrio sp. WXL103 TaxID=3450710 RepID=UPI003EC890A1